MQSSKRRSRTAWASTRACASRRWSANNLGRGAVSDADYSAARVAAFASAATANKDLEAAKASAFASGAVNYYTSEPMFKLVCLHYKNLS